MNGKKLLAMLLALTMLLLLLSGCGQSKESGSAEPAQAAQTAEPAGEEAQTDDAGLSQEEEDDITQAVMDAFAAGYSKHKGDELVCTIDGYQVPWRTIAPSSSANSCVTSGWAVFMASRGVLGEEYLTVTVASSCGPACEKRRTGVAEGFHSYASGSGRRERWVTIIEKTSILSRTFALSMSPHTMMACS